MPRCLVTIGYKRVFTLAALTFAAATAALAGNPPDPVETQVVPTGQAPCGVVTSPQGRVWIGHGSGARSLTSIDPLTHRMRRLDVRTTSPGWPRCIRGELWVTSPETVLRIDPRSGRLLGRLRLGGTLSEAALGPDGLVWVTDKERSLVHRVFARELAPAGSFAAGPGAFSLARAGEAMWITSFAGSDVRRYVP